ncbi:MAG: hypothetical protein BMS9Abin36_0348 [Gammaproteobacteria bacterium]|nr:MAG: hypothetical protein BMS9Abin36_0348 [Gammaproteobacteria bacterium]
MRTGAYIYAGMAGSVLLVLTACGSEQLAQTREQAALEQKAIKLERTLYENETQLSILKQRCAGNLDTEVAELKQALHAVTSELVRVKVDRDKLKRELTTYKKTTLQ